MATEEARPAKTLAQKLDRLFRAAHPRGRSEYTLEEVAEGIRARGGPTISVSYLWQLRRGERDNPRKSHLQALAEFFGVSPAYFFDDEAAARIDAQLELLAALRDASVRHLALRAFDLSPVSLAAIAAMVEHARRLEGLPTAPPDGQAGGDAEAADPEPHRGRGAGR